MSVLTNRLRPMKVGLLLTSILLFLSYLLFVNLETTYADAKLTNTSDSNKTGSFVVKKEVTNGEYKGIVQIVKIDNNTYEVDEGAFRTKTASDSRSQSGSASCGQNVSSTIPSSVYYNDGEYSGTLGQRTYSYSDTTAANCATGRGTYSFSRNATYSGTVVGPWISNWKTYGNYDAAYAGYTRTLDIIDQALGTAPNCACEGDPINMSTGNFMLWETDMSISDRGVPLSINRNYNTLDDGSGLFGEGWRFEYDSYLDLSKAPSKIIVTYPTGRKVHFLKEAGTNQYKAGKTVFDELKLNADSTYVLTLKNKQIYTYSAQGKLLSITDPNRNQLSFEYNGSGDLATIRGASGITVSITVINGKIKSIQDQTGRILTYDYDGSGRLEVVHGLGGNTTYYYDQHGIRKVIDANGNNKVINEYDEFGRVITQTDAEGNKLTISYDDLNRENTVTYLNTGKTIIYEYDDDFFISKEKYKDGTYKAYTYDNKGNLITSRDRKGNITTYTYDDQGNMLTSVSPAPFYYTTEFVYDSNDQVKIIKLPDGGQTEFDYDFNGNVVEKRFKAEGNTYFKETYAYDSNGRLTRVTDPENRTTYYEYAEGNNPTKIKDNLGTIQEYEYDTLGRIKTSTTMDGKTTYEYNNQDLVAKVVNPANAIQRLKYDGMGNLLKIILPEAYNAATDDGAGTTYSYDKLYNTVKVSDPLNNVTAFKYDQAGQIIKSIQANQYHPATNDGTGNHYEYDPDGNMIRITYPDGKQARYMYDPSGNLIKYIDANHYHPETDSGLGSTYDYDELNRLVEVRDPSGTVTERNVYDAMGRVIKSIDATGYLSGMNDSSRIGAVYKYNFSGWLIETREPLRSDKGTVYYRITRYEYDQSGKLLNKRISPDEVTLTSEPETWNTIENVYDVRGNIKSISDSQGSLISYQYDDLGRTIEERMKINETTERVTGYHYNSMGLMDKQWVEVNGSDIGSDDPHVQAVTAYEYDKNGNVKQITSPVGDIVTYEYDQGDRLVKVNKKVQKDTLTENHVKLAVTSPKQLLYPGQTYDLQLQLDSDESINTVDVVLSYDVRMLELISVTPEVTNVNEDHSTLGLIHINGENLSLNGKQQLVKISLKAKDYTQGVASVLIQPDSTYVGQSGEQHAFTETIGHSFKLQGPDMNRNGRVETDDFTITAQVDGVVKTSPQFDTKFDINDSGAVDTPDLDYIKDWLFLDQLPPANSYEKIASKSVELQYQATHSDVFRSMTYKYDATGNIVKETDSEGQSISYSYDELNRIISQTDKQNGVTLYGYDQVGNVIKSVLPKDSSEGLQGKGTTYIYDDLNRLVMIKDPLNRVIQRSIYDVRGQLIKQMDGEGYASAQSDENRFGTIYSYDLAGRLVTVAQPEAALKGKVSVSYQYNAFDFVVRIVDGEGEVTTYLRDMWGKPKEVIDAEGNHTYYTYDFAGNLSSLTNGKGDKKAYTTNSLNQRASLTDGLGQTVTYQYDLMGRMTRMKDRNGNDTAYTYNSDNQITGVKVSETGEQELYLYNQNGSLLAAINGEMIDRFTYTDNGWLKQYKRNGDMHVAYQYNSEGQQLSVQDATGTQTTYSYNEAGQMEQVHSNGKLVAEYQYNRDDAISKILDANGTSIAYNYDKNQNTLGVTSKNGQNQVLDQRVYTYDNNGNKLSALVNGKNTQYTYDKLQQLTSVQDSTTSESYSYDQAGNRLSHRTSVQETTYEYDANNRLISTFTGEEKTSYTYDQNGNMLSAVGPASNQSYTYDGFNRLINSDLSNGNWMTYSYDPLGLRSGISENGMQTDFIFSGSEMIAEVTPDGHRISSYIRGNNLLAMTDAQNKQYAYLQDAHGDIVGLTDSSGKLTSSYKYDAFGNINKLADGVDNRFGYSGEQLDPITGQVYLRARNYDPSLGRFINEDTYEGNINDPLSLNLYTYVGNNPLNFSDPSGHIKMRSDGNLALELLGITFSDYHPDNKPVCTGLLSKERARDKKNLKPQERYVVDLLLSMGKDVYLNPEAKGDSGQYDFKVNGYYKVELKTAFPENRKINISNAIEKIRYGIEKQGAEVVIYDLTYDDVDYELKDIINLSSKLKDIYKDTNFRYDIQVWTNEGIYFFEDGKLPII